MYLKPGQNFYLRAYTISPTSAAPTNADSLPTAILLRNGAVDGAVTLTVSNPATGTYKIVGSVPSGYAEGDFCQVEFTSTVGGVAGSTIPDSGTWIVETAYNADIAATVTATNTRALLALPAVAPGANGGLPLGDGAGKVLLQPSQVTALTPPTANAVADALLDRTDAVETGLTPRQCLRLVTAILANKAGESNGTWTPKRADGTTTAVTIVHDALGNRISSTYGTL